MQEVKSKVTMNGEPVTLEGYDIEIGEQAPDSTLIDNDLSEFRLSSLKGNTLIISVVPSLDTSVCDLQTRRFNEEAGSLGHRIKILTISMDLPFAQKRWCGAADVQHVQTLSDHRSAEFGLAYGVLIKGVRLLTRTVFIVGADGILKYKQIVPEITDEPDYGDVLVSLNKIV